MAIWDKISWSNIKNLFVTEDIDQTKTEQLRAIAAPQMDTDKKGVIYKLKQYWKARVEQELKIWKRAVALAEDVLRPRREELYRVYHRAMEDDHLLAQVRTARFTVQMSDFRLSRDGQEDETAREVFERPWFDALIRHAVDAEFYGHSLIEFDSRMENGEFTNVLLVPREHVRPEYGEVVIYTHDEVGLPYREKPFNKYLVEVGEPFDLGLLKVASKVVIRKEYALTDWSHRNEKYGMPFLVIKASTRNDAELQAKAEMAANFGSNSWGIFDDMDEINLKESNQAFAYQAFQAYSDWADAAISMLINGQTGTMEEKAFVGSAEVHERILNTYTKARMRRIEYFINFKLIPFLISHGYPLEGVKFEYLDLLPKEKKPMPDSMGEGTEQDADNDLGFQKKNVSLSASPIADIYNKVCCEDHEHMQQLNNGIDVGKIIDQAARKVFDKRVQPSDLDPASWKYFSDELTKALYEGFGQELSQISYRRSTDWELVAQLRNNIYVFSAFKNHKNITDMVNALTDDQGNLREWRDFKAIADQINANYFEDWLRAEYNTAVATGQTTAKWQQFQQNADVLPFLTYVTQKDARVREAHRVLEGVTKRIDDPYWDNFYPPNGWNCRCDIIQSAGPETTDNFLEPNEEQVPPIFRNNPAKSRELYGQDHPYFKDMPAAQKERLLKATSKLVYDNYGEDWNKRGYDRNTGGYVVEHLRHDPRRSSNNRITAKELMREGEPVELLPATIGNENPDASRAGRLWVFEQLNELANIVPLLQAAERRGNRILLRAQAVDKNEIIQAVRDYRGSKNLTFELRFDDNTKTIIE